jgi:hypothetical protein
VKVERSGHYYDKHRGDLPSQSPRRRPRQPRGASLHPQVSKPMNYLKKLHTALPESDSLFPRLKTDVTQVNSAMPAF